MKTHRNLYNEIISFKNLFLAWKKARKGKTKKPDVIKFEKYLGANLKGLENLCKQKVRTEGTLIYHSEPLQSYSGLSAHEREWQMEQVARDNQWQTEAMAKWLRKRLRE